MDFSIGKNWLFLAFISFVLVDLIFSGLGSYGTRDCDPGLSGEVLVDVPKLSELQGTSIGESAYAARRISLQEDHEALSPEIWIFLLTSYFLLLLFNLSFGLSVHGKVQWLFESILTVVALSAWAFWGEGKLLWYPEFLLKGGIVIYFGYLVLLRRIKKPF